MHLITQHTQKLLEQLLIRLGIMGSDWRIPRQAEWGPPTFLISAVSMNPQSPILPEDIEGWVVYIYGVGLRQRGGCMYVTN